MRGDYRMNWEGILQVGGPSPRAWGLLGVPSRDELGHRAIPTCVGTTGWPYRPPWPVPVHPHVRGDYGWLPSDRAAYSGPSPRAWGLLVVVVAGHHDHRAIPTCVGTTVHVPLAIAKKPGHPHVRGDYARRRAQLMLPSGPSPRAWGLRGHRRPGDVGKRAIPTCVGTTEGPRPVGGGGPGHPHVRGDYGPVLGSGPRARRAIPTCVGTTKCKV